MNVTPSTNLYLLRGVPITNNYKDTLYFASKTDQYNYFYSKRIQTYSDFTYQRVESGKVRVALGAETCYTCNYLMFQNENFGTKWFYAFITGVEYVNNACTEITYELDKVQTWFYDLTLKPCMVVRQHATNDGYYVNCEPEAFADDAKYVSWEQDCTEGNVFVTLSTGHMNVGTMDSVWNPNTQYALINNIPCALEVNYFQDTDAGRRDLVTFIQNIVNGGHEQDLIAVYCTSAFVGLAPNAGIPTFGDYGANKQTLRTGAFQGYTPKNNKMYNYPFCKLAVKSPTNEKHYAIEDFRTGTGTTQIDSANFYVYAVTIPTPTLLIVPRNYRGETVNYDEGIDITDFPYVPISGDTFKMWCVQNNGGYLANFIGQLSALAFSSDAVGTYIGIRQSIQEGANWLGQSINASQRPDNVYGLEKGNIFSNLKKNGFRLQCLTYDYWKARQVDSYFTMYGYAENHVMTPNIHARQKWTYVQTSGCTLVGNAPSDDISFIENCFNNGITWWVNPSEVGNYELTNATL